VPDTIVITCARPVLNQTIVVTLPEGVANVLDFLAANTMIPDQANPGQQKPKYAYAMNVVWQDVLAMLLPMWTEQFRNLTFQARTAALVQSIQQAVSSITVVGP
jgi:hypothetical protein